MLETYDHWFIRLPNGRVVRAVNTAVVRQQVGAGRIPRNSSVRRSPEEEWTTLEWTREFADLLTAPISPSGTPRPAAPATLVGAIGEVGGVSERLDPSQFHTVGVRTMTHELLTALDATLVRNKLAAAALGGVFCGLVLALVLLPPLPFEAGMAWLRQLLAGAAILAALAATFGLLTNWTFIEASRLRPARWREALRGLGRLAFRLALAWLLTAGAAGGLIALLRVAPGFILQQSPPGWVADVSAVAAVAVGLILEVLLWPVIGFALLLPPILVVERCSVLRALGCWVRLLRQDPGRVFVYEALALGLGGAAALLLALPLAALYAYRPDPSVAVAADFTRLVLSSLALAPLLAYLSAANLFIYLNLRYESGGRR